MREGLNGIGGVWFGVFWPYCFWFLLLTLLLLLLLLQRCTNGRKRGVLLTIGALGMRLGLFWFAVLGVTRYTQAELGFWRRLIDTGLDERAYMPYRMKLNDTEELPFCTLLRDMLVVH